jgi:5-(carboxyamino)imidazole ribonucleotide synthase|tara:strand:+ start:2376 stop:3455 length:1080 start_codon:yes stop_codon:yes gene_type:complete
MKIGILGGGQLAMMMIEKSLKHNVDFIVLDPSHEPPASRYADCIKSGFEDKKALDRLVSECNVVTIDFENVPSGTLKYIEKSINVFPCSHAVEVCQDRLKEKLIFNKNDIPTTEYKIINNEADLLNAISDLGTDTILKSRKLGYDGKNQIDIRDANIKNVWEESGKVEAILEKKINFKTELSIIGVCTKSGNTLFYPLVENFHKNGILDISIAPYKDLELQKRAESYHRKISKELNYIGVLVIEFFLTDNEELIANEMAPRVHNSGHWTNEGANISQFEAHIMAISGMSIEKISVKGNSGMLNILSKMPDNKIIENNSNMKLYNYGKSERPNRKLGHITLTCDNKETLISTLSGLRDKI